MQHKKCEEMENGPKPLGINLRDCIYNRSCRWHDNSDMCDVLGNSLSGMIPCSCFINCYKYLDTINGKKYNE